MKKCFLIDDDAVFNLISIKMIERSSLDLETKTFVSAKLALEELKNIFCETQDCSIIIFLDIRMPDMDGFAFLNEVKKMPVSIQNCLHIYILSSSLDQRDIVRAMSVDNVKGFLSKPLEEAAVTRIFNSLK